MFHPSPLPPASGSEPRRRPLILSLFPGVDLLGYGGSRMTCEIIQSDCFEFLRAQPERNIDLVMGSPPYTDARTYDDGTLPPGAVVVRDCLQWVDWMLDVTAAAVHACKGLVLWVCAGVQRELNYWPAPEGLVWEWWKRGNHLWRPCVWWKVDENDGGTGIPGSGGKQWLRNDWEYVLAFKREGWLPWADPLVMGHPPVVPRLGGEMSNRSQDGQRANDPWQKRGRDNNLGGRTKGGRLSENHSRPMPKIANPGNVIVVSRHPEANIVKARVGGKHMGSKLCHFSEAPYPEALAEFFVRSFCLPGGLCCDPFLGSGTTAVAAIRHGRNFIGCDLRESQVRLAKKRIGEETPFGLYRTCE